MIHFMATPRRTRASRNDAFGQWLDVTLNDRGIKGIELASQLGVHDSAVSRWRSGVGRPTMASVIRLAKILEVDPLQLAATAGLLDGDAMGIPALPPPPIDARRERVREQIQAIKGLTEYSKQRLLEIADAEFIGDGHAGTE